jgi:hypothetical protein
MGNTNRSRRAALAIGGALLLGALAAACLPAAGETAPPAPQKFKAIKIDVSPLAGNGLGPEAEWMAQDLRASLQGAFAARLAPGDRAAPILLVRIDLLTLGMSGGGGTEPFGGGAARDNIQGAGIVVAPNGATLATYPLFTTVLALTGGSAREVGTERRRVTVLANSFAQWLPGQMGL